jgi:hypothetical protein
MGAFARVMIELHVSPERTDLDLLVEQQLLDLVLAHSVRVSDGTQVPVDLPAMRDGDRWVEAEQLEGHMDDLRRLVADWRKFQSDVCYIEDDGSVC